jgi:uncharacterized protein
MIMNPRSFFLKLLALMLVLAVSLITRAGNTATNNLLWRISGNGLEQPSYVFGTIHLICADDMVTFDKVEQKMRKTNRLVLELNLEDPMVLFSMVQQMVMKNDTRLHDLLSDEDYRLVADFFKDSLDTDLATQAHIQPFFLISMIMPHMLGCHTDSYEYYLMGLSKELGIPLKGLETVDEQMDVFARLSYQEQAEILVESIRDYDKGRKEFLEMVSYYLAMDLEGMQKLTESVETDFEAFNYALLEERNKRWIPRMSGMMQETPTFFGVGAGHFPGHTGIIQLLREAGFTVEPLL